MWEERRKGQGGGEGDENRGMKRIKRESEGSILVDEYLFFVIITYSRCIDFQQYGFILVLGGAAQAGREATGCGLDCRVAIWNHSS